MAGSAAAWRGVYARSEELEGSALLAVERRAFFDLLRMANTLESPRGIARQLAVLARQLSGCEAVGIRLKEGPDFPYAAHLGFPEEFVALEDSLCSTGPDGRLLRDAQRRPILGGFCGRVLSAPMAADQLGFTARGSFIAASPSRSHGSQHRECPRHQCGFAGYATVGLFPIRMDEVTYGLIQCNDRRPGLLTGKVIDLMEGLASSAAHLLQLAMA